LYLEFQNNYLKTGTTSDFEVLTEQYPSSKMLTPDTSMNLDFIKNMILILNQCHIHVLVSYTASFLQNQIR
ncbi:MAG: hypothetical protein KDD45_15475, partial [Bdellovibrionales bacterium]|nr:hypothetical protein [Bdellovibrionales bacterium]